MAGQSLQCRGKSISPVPSFFPLPPLNQGSIFPAQSTPGPCLLANREATRPKHCSAGPTTPSAAALPSRLQAAPCQHWPMPVTPARVVPDGWLRFPGTHPFPALSEPQQFTGNSLTVSQLSSSTHRSRSPEPGLSRPAPGMAGSSPASDVPELLGDRS